jgi:hypothetical protein
MQPINYGVEIQDPSQSFLSAFQTGASIQDMRAKQEQQQQQMANQKLIQEGFAKLRQPGATAADYANLAMVLPETQAKAVRESFNMLSGERQQNALQQSGQIFSALKSGKPEIAIGLIGRQIEAKRNSGDEEGAKFLETWRDVTKENPKATEDYFGFTISQMPGGDKVIESSVKLGGERRAEAQAPAELRQKLAAAGKTESDAQIRAEEAKNIAAVIKADLEKKAADLGLTKAQTGSALAQSKKLGVETAKAVLELEALKAGVGDPKEKFNQEEKIRKEYQGRTKVYGELGSTFSNIQSSANAKSGPGDIALITGFMKMLDPGSVVRETEFATARDTAGLYTRLENSLKKAESGQFLQPFQRQEFVNLAKQYYESAQKKAEQEKKDLGIVVKNYKLNPENVFGAEAAPATPSSLPASATVGGKTYSRPASFTDVQWRDYLKANGVIQ